MSKDRIQPAAPVLPEAVEKKRGFNGGLEPGVSVRSLPRQRVDVEPEDPHKELLTRVAKMNSKEFTKFKSDPANVKALDEAQRRKRGLYE
jgi:hypothetical protein